MPHRGTEFEAPSRTRVQMPRNADLVSPDERNLRGTRREPFRMLWSRRQKKDDMQCPVRNSFPRRGRIGFMGGAAVSFVLADKEDTVLAGL
jgi:hypothetical protein